MPLLVTVVMAHDGCEYIAQNCTCSNGDTGWCNTHDLMLQCECKKSDGCRELRQNCYCGVNRKGYCYIGPSEPGIYCKCDNNDGCSAIYNNCHTYGYEGYCDVTAIGNGLECITTLHDYCKRLDQTCWCGSIYRGTCQYYHNSYLTCQDCFLDLTNFWFVLMSGTIIYGGFVVIGCCCCVLIRVWINRRPQVLEFQNFDQD